MSLFYQISEIDCPEFLAAIELYESAFPPRERVSSLLLAEKVKDRIHQLFVGKIDDQVVCMAILCEPILEQFVLLGYLATLPEFRDQGIGANFVNYMLALLRDRSQYLLLEVEDPQSGLDQNLRQRRVNFYRRLGAKQMKNVRYILPPLSGDESTDMILMLAPEYPGNRIAGERVKQLITQLYVEFYQRRLDDPLLRLSLQTIGEFVALI